MHNNGYFKVFWSAWWLRGGAHSMSHGNAFWDDYSVHQELFAHPISTIHFSTFYRCRWNFTVTICVKAPGTIMEEVMAGNGNVSYNSSLKDWLGLWATSWSEGIQTGDGKSGSAPLIFSPQTVSQLGCELRGGEVSLFLWVSLHPQSHCLYTAVQSRLLY